MSLPYANATSGRTAMDDIRKSIQAFGCSKFAPMEDLAAGRAWCHVCGRHWTLSSAEIAAEIEHQRAYMEAETENVAIEAKGCGE